MMRTEMDKNKKQRTNPIVETFIIQSQTKDASVS